ncbi:MAG: hypothetical protein ACK5ME_05360 [Parahaliea sp.]
MQLLLSGAVLRLVVVAFAIVAFYAWLGVFARLNETVPLPLSLFKSLNLENPESEETRYASVGADTSLHYPIYT